MSTKKRRRRRRRRRRKLTRKKSKEKKKKPTCWRWSPTWGVFLEAHFMNFPLLVFSPKWGENFLVGPKRKYPDPTIYFSSPPPNQTLQKGFSSHFISKIFYLPYFTSKQTHPKAKAWVLALLGQNCHDDDTSQTNPIQLNPLDWIGF